MNALARPSISAAHRARVLRALGLMPWVRREQGGAPLAHAEAAPVLAAAAASAFVLVLPQDVGAPERDMLARALAAADVMFAQAPQVSPRDGELLDVPVAAAYLVFGQAQAHALGRCLDAAALQRAQIVLVDAPSALLVDAAAKRRLWTALRGLRRMTAASD